MDRFIAVIDDNHATVLINTRYIVTAIYRGSYWSVTLTTGLTYAGALRGTLPGVLHIHEQEI